MRGLRANVRREILALFALAIVAPGCCSSCGSVAPQAGGPTPYARCAIAEPPSAREVRAGELTLRIADRDLTVEGLSAPFRVAVFRGVAPQPEPLGPTLEGFASSGARLAIVVGGIGDDAASAVATITALAQLDAPVLVLAGGRDDPELISAAIGALDPAARDRVIDVSALRRIRLGPIVLVPVPGAPDGRYARSDGACGIGEDDLAAIGAELGEPGDERRVLLSWAVPSGVAAAIGLEGADAGSAEIAALATRIGAAQGIHGWPDVHAGEVLEGHAIAPAIAGPALVRADGSRAPSGFLLVSVSGAGIAMDSP